MWVNAYKQIYAVNNIIEGIEESQDYLDESTSNQIRGEAYFIRALLHFYLVNPMEKFHIYQAPITKIINLQKE
jgi:hypothetical protein